MAKKSITGSALSQGLEDVEKLKAEWAAKRTLISEYVPAGTDKATYHKLLKAVQEEVAKNESIAAFQGRVKRFGSRGGALRETLEAVERQRRSVHERQDRGRM